jgi:hypothetical protein
VSGRSDTGCALSTGPVGTMALMVNVIHTNAPQGAPLTHVRPASFSLPHTTRRE